jgi:hypothetical protein
MSVTHVVNSNFRDLRVTLIQKAIDHPPFREDLSKTLQSTAAVTQSLSIGQVTDRVTSFVQGLRRANRVALADHYDQDYRGTPQIKDGGTVRSAAWMLDTLEYIDYNTQMALPSSRSERFELDGWGGSPEHALRIFDRVGLAVADLWNETEASNPALI